MSRAKTQNPTRPPKKRLATPPQLTPIDEADVDAAFDVIRMESEPSMGAAPAEVLVDVDADAAAAAAAIADLSMDDDVPIEVESGADFAPDLSNLAEVKKADSPTRRARTQPIEAALEDMPVKRGPPKPPPKKSDATAKSEAPEAKGAKSGPGIPSILSKVKAAERATGSPVGESDPSSSDASTPPSSVASSTVTSTPARSSAPVPAPSAAAAPSTRAPASSVASSVVPSARAATSVASSTTASTGSPTASTGSPTGSTGSPTGSPTGSTSSTASSASTGSSTASSALTATGSSSASAATGPSTASKGSSTASTATGSSTASKDSSTASRGSSTASTASTATGSSTASKGASTGSTGSPTGSTASTGSPTGSTASTGSRASTGSPTGSTGSPTGSTGSTASTGSSTATNAPTGSPAASAGSPTTGSPTASMGSPTSTTSDEGAPSSRPLVAPSTGGASLGRISVGTPRTTPPKPPPRPATSTRPPPAPTPSAGKLPPNASGPATRAETVAGTPVGGVPLRPPVATIQDAPPTIVTPNPLASLDDALASSSTSQRATSADPPAADPDAIDPSTERWAPRANPPPLGRADSVLELAGSDAKRESDSEIGGGRAFPRGESAVSHAPAYVPPKRAKRATSQRDYDVEDEDAMTSADLAAKLREINQAPPRPPSEMEPPASARPASYLEYAVRAGLPRKGGTEVPTSVQEPPSRDSGFDIQPVPTKILDAALDFPEEKSEIGIQPVPTKVLDAALSFDSEGTSAPAGSTKLDAPSRRSEMDIQPVPTKVLEAALRFDSEPSVKGPAPAPPTAKPAPISKVPAPKVPAPAPNTKAPLPKAPSPSDTKVATSPSAAKPGKAPLPPPRSDLPKLALHDSMPSIGKVDTKILEHAIRPESEPAITVSRAESEFDYSSLALDNDGSGRMVVEQVPRANSALERALVDSVDISLDDESGDFGPAIAPLRTMQLAERGPSMSDALERDDTPILQLGVYENAANLPPASSAIVGAGHAITVSTSEREDFEQIGIAMTDGHLDAILVGLPGGEVLIKAALSMAPWGPIVIAACSGKADEAARQANAAGADLVAIRPHDPERLGPVLLAAARILEQRRDLMAAQQGREEDLLTRLGSDAESDEVGGLLSFDAFQRALELELKRVRRYQYALSLGLFALDFASPPPSGIKGILRARAGNALLHSIRDIDMATELDQERFLVLLPYTDLSGATEVARRIISAVRAIPPVMAAGGEFQPTLVGAIAGAKPGQQLSFNKLIRDAQRALEAARRDGAELAVQP